MKKAFEIEYKYKKVEIHIIDFVGDVRNINGTPDLFSLSYNSNIKDKGQYIIATEAEINIYEDAYFNIDELKTVGETDILIKYFEHDELVWQGFALPDFFQTGITKPRVLRIVATDRLGVLKNITNISASDTPKEIIEECLLQTGLTLPVEIRSVDNYLTSTTIERERIDGISAYDVIRTFMVQFNSKIVQYKNRWWIVNKKLLEEGFSDQEIIDIDLVYLDGQREIKPTASEVSLFLEFGGSKKYPENWNFEKWDGSKFEGWSNNAGFSQGMRINELLFYSRIDGYYKAYFSEKETENKSLWYVGRWYGNKVSDNILEYPNLKSTFVNIPKEKGFIDIALNGNFTTRDGMPIWIVPIIHNKNNDNYFTYNKDGLILKIGSGTPNLNQSNFDYVHNPRASSQAGFNPDDFTHAVVNVNWDIKNTFDLRDFGSDSDEIEIQVAFLGGIYLQGALDYGTDVFLNSVNISLNDNQVTGKGLIFKTKQGGDKFSKVRETETTLFSDKINQGVNGYFYNYKYDDTSITNLPKEYLLEMTRQMADMFCSARDFYSLGGKFKVNPLARYRCGYKYFVFVGGVSHRENSEIDIEEIVSNDTLIRTDYIYTYFEDSKDNIKSIGTASGSGGSGGGGGSGGMTSSQLEVLTNLADWWKLDEENDAIYSEKSVYSLNGVSALGLGEGGGSGGGGVDMLDAWANYTEAKANFYAPASLLVPFRNDTLSRLTSLESGSGSDTSIVTTGTGNAITSLTKSGSEITADKGLTFALASHNHDAIYKPIGYVPSWGEVTGKPAIFAPSAHTHTIANVTGLQTALDGKEPSFAKNTAFNKNFGTEAGTVAQGNDSRINNGQTAFGWGNHSSAGYALNSALTAHINKVDNPHAVTKSQVGLSNVDNESKAQMFSYANLTQETSIEQAYIDYAQIDSLYIPNGVQIGGWKFKQVGTELHFMYNNVVKVRMLSDGTILATGGITTLSTE